MHCDQALDLISAQIDNEISAEDRACLDEHLGLCPTCRASLEAYQLQDRDLDLLFEPRRQAVQALVEQVNARLDTVAATSAKWRPAHGWRPVALFWAAAAALAIGLPLLWRLHTAIPRAPRDARDLTRDALLKDDADHLMPRPRQAARPVASLKVGDSVTTKAGERRRVGLPDGSILYVNQHTAVHIDSDRQATLSSGSVFLEVAPKPAEGATFVVKTPSREVEALGTRFSCQADKTGTEVLVTQGQVAVSGLDAPLEAGQLLPRDARQPQPAPRTSHLLDWTRDLIAAAESPLVPGSQYTGGALVAVDSAGQQARLSLRKFHVDVHIEDGFARTTIDQTYFNHHPWRLEGTFYFPLPPDASLSRLAMYVDGNLMEGGMAERDYARSVYEKIVRTQRDPALLEWVDGSTFKMRVFPLEGRQEKRIILSYSQRLPALYGRMSYRFPAGHNLELVRDWSFAARVRNGAGWQAASPSHPTMTMARDHDDLVLVDRAHGVKLDQDMVLELNNPANAGQPGETARLSRAEHDNAGYLMLRFRPDLPGRLEPQRRDWVFLFESSADRDPLLARTQIEIVRTLLAQVGHDDTFNILTAATRNHLWSTERMPATPDNIQEALAWLESTHLVGALDLDLALRDAEAALAEAGNPHLVHLGSGITAMGRPQNELAKTIPENIHYVGIGVGKRWGRDLMKQAAERTGGFYTQINPDESVGWRTFDLLATLNTPRLLGASVEAVMPGKQEQPLMLVDNPSVAQGEELCAMTRLTSKTAVLPETLIIKGYVDGQPYRREVIVRVVAGGAGYLPRTWAKLEIDRLLAESAERNKQRVIELSKAMYVMTPFTSLLVLESEAMYKEFKVDRGRKDHWALYPCPAKILVVYEPDPSLGIDVRNAPKDAKPNAQQVMQTVLDRQQRFFLYPLDPAGPGPFIDGTNPSRGFWVSAFDDEMPIVSINAIVTNLQNQTGVNSGRVKAGRRLARITNWLPQFDPNTGIPIDPNRMGDEGGMEMSIRGAYDNLGFYPPSMALVVKAASRIHPLTFSPDGKRVASWGPSLLSRAPHTEGLWEQPSGRSPLLLVDDPLTDQRVTFYEKANGVRLSSRARFLPRTKPELAQLRAYWMRDSSGSASASFDPFADQSAVFTGQGIRSGADRFDNWVDWSKFKISQGTISRGWGRVEGNGVADPLDVGFTTYFKSGLRSGFYYQPNSVRNTPLAFPLNSNLSFGVSGLVGYDPLYDATIVFTGQGITSGTEYSQNERLFFTDLLSHAPGLNSSVSDIQAVVEAEAAPALGNTRGTIAPAARKLIDRARKAGWQTLTLPGGPNSPEVRIAFDGQGRYRYERTLPLGLREEVVCDGTTLLHLYRELGLAARRTVSRFHRAEMAHLFPWLPLPAEDLARGADLLAVDAHTVAIVPHTPRNDAVPEKDAVSYRQHLVFADDGRLVERQLVVMPGRKVLLREVHDGKGLRRLLDDEGKELLREQIQLRPASAPDLKPNLADLVVLNLPLRSRNHVMTKLSLQPNFLLTHPNNARYKELSATDALALLTTLTAERNPDDARVLFQSCFQGRQLIRRGHFVLLAAAGVNLETNPAFAELLARQPDDPLIRYLAMTSSSTYRWLQTRLPLYLGRTVAPEGTIFGELSRFRDLLLICGQAPNTLPRYLVRKDQEAAAFDFIRRRPHSPLALALLCYLPAQGGMSKAGHLQRAALWERLAGPEKNYEAGYEQARALLQGGRPAAARTLFVELYDRALHQKTVPAIDRDFRQALQATGPDDPWSAHMRKSAAWLIEHKLRPAVVVLAMQAHRLDDQPLADNLLTLALAAIKDDAERVRTYSAAIGFLSEAKQAARAHKLVAELLRQEVLARSPLLWRLAAKLADDNGQPGEAVAALERALDLEYQDLPAVIDLQQWRADYRRLLDHYRNQADAALERAVATPRLVSQVIRAADRWRAHDPDEGAAACELAAAILTRLGQHNLAWDYRTTPIAYQHGEGPKPADLAAAYERAGERALADRAYQVAIRANPSRGMLLWNRAMNLRHWGKAAEARAVLQQLALDKDNQWGTLKQRAQWQLEQE